MINYLKTKYYQWKYRHIEDDLCCCGRKITGTWCGSYYGCRSAKEYAITSAANKDKK